MNLQRELIERVAQHHKAQVGSMSPEAYEELYQAVAHDLDTYLKDPSDIAFKRLAEVLTREDEQRSGEEFMDDEAFEAARKKRRERLRAGCEEVLALDVDCLDAATIMALTSSDEANDICCALSDVVDVWEEAHAEELLVVHRALGEDGAAGEDGTSSVFKRPYLRALAALARWELNTTRYAAARETCEVLLDHEQALNPSDPDPLGGRYTLAIALARLEDEAAFNALDARFGHQGNAWSHIARALLMFKLDRMSAASRALKAYNKLCRGGAYALLRPVYVELYVPDRPLFEPGSFEEAVLAVHECDPVIMDTPDFLPWCITQKDFFESAQSFAQDNDLDW